MWLTVRGIDMSAGLFLAPAIHATDRQRGHGMIAASRLPLARPITDHFRVCESPPGVSHVSSDVACNRTFNVTFRHTLKLSV